VRFDGRVTRALDAVGVCVFAALIVIAKVFGDITDCSPPTHG
jgi:hypothetical protein